jgi:hypothetical protein
MQIPTFNKIINLFVVGVFTVSIGLFLFGSQLFTEITTFIDTHPLPGSIEPALGPLVTVSGAVVLLSVTMFLGVAIDGLSDVLIRGFLLKWIITKHRYTHRLFAIKNQFNTTEMLRYRFHELLEESSKYVRLKTQSRYKFYDDNGDKAEHDKVYGSAIFFETAKPDLVNWLSQPYYLYLLASNFILPLLVLIALCFQQFFSMSLLSVLFIALYGLVRVSLHRRLFSYEIVYRQCVIILAAELESASAADVTVPLVQDHASATISETTTTKTPAS